MWLLSVCLFPRYIKQLSICKSITVIKIITRTYPHFQYIGYKGMDIDLFRWYPDPALLGR